MDTQLAGVQVGKGREARFSEASPDLPAIYVWLRFLIVIPHPTASHEISGDGH